jgi:hypothetical protein
MSDDLVERFEAIVSTNEYLVLATADADGRPWSTPVWFATADATHFYWVSKPGARHSVNISGRPEVAFAVFDSTQPAGTGLGVYVAATAGQVQDDDLDAGLAVFSAASQDAGAGPWTRKDAQGRLRLYCATAHERFVLSSSDERIPVPTEHSASG